MKIHYFMAWIQQEKPCKGSIYRLPEHMLLQNFSTYEKIESFFEELKLVKILKREEGICEIEILPLLEIITDLYENMYEKGKEVQDEDELIEFYFGEYLNKLIPEQKRLNLDKLFQGSAEYENHSIDLEIKIRDTKVIRVIRFNLSNSLYTLHDMIQQAFEFDNDHLFAFYVGQGMMKKTYTLPEAITSEEELSVLDTRLGDLELCKGQKFSYLFDFGDMWWFDIKVLKILEDTVPKPVIIKKVDDAPKQY